MPLFRRIADILSANVNELVDRFEDPEKMLRQAVREMETAVEQTMDSAAKSIASERLLVRQLDEHRRASERCFERARGAVGQGDDDAARGALAAKAGHDKLAVALEDQIAAARRHNARLRRQLDALRVRVAEARQTMHLLIARNRAARTQRQFAIDTQCFHAGSDALNRFNHHCGRIERTEAEAHAWLELTADDAFDPAGADADVELQLAALKQESRANSSAD